MSQIDSVGTYTFEVLESGVGLTKNGFPQWVARLKATRKWIETADEMAHFKLEAPGYVDWSSFDEEMNAYLVLFKSKDEFSSDTKLLNYEQLQLAMGWDGTEFDSLSNFAGKLILGRVEENNYQDKITLRVNWIDHVDASPERSLKVLDDTAIKGLTAKLKIAKPAAPAKPATAAKPATKPATKPANPTPAAAGAKATPATAATAPVAPPKTAPVSPAASPPSSAPPKTTKKKTTPPTTTTAPDEAPVEETTGLPAEVSQLDGWNYIMANKGSNEDSTMEDAWLAACNEVGEDRKEDDFTTADWAKVRDIVVRDLALDK